MSYYQSMWRTSFRNKLRQDYFLKNKKLEFVYFKRYDPEFEDYLYNTITKLVNDCWRKAFVNQYIKIDFEEVTGINIPLGIFQAKGVLLLYVPVEVKPTPIEDDVLVEEFKDEMYFIISKN